MTTTKIRASAVSMQFIGHGERVTGHVQGFALEASGPGVGQLLEHAVGLLGRVEMIPEDQERVNVGLARARLGAEPLPPRLPPARKLKPLTARQEQVLATVRHKGPITARAVAAAIWDFEGYAGVATKILGSLQERELVIKIDGKWVAR